MILFPWRYSLIGFAALLIVECWGQKTCPSQEAILPCRCLMKGEQFQIWCSHSDLPNVLEGLRSLAQFIVQPIDELIIENNFLPSLPGRTFLPLKIMRLMLRYNGLERVSSDWLVGLDESLMELFIVEPDLRSLPDDSLIHLNSLEAITIQTNLIKRFPSFSSLAKLRYVQLESLSLLELSARGFRDLQSLQIIHVGNCPRLERLEADLFLDLPNLYKVNISHCGVKWMHPRAIMRLPSLRELSLVGNRITDAGMVGRASRELPNLEILRLDDNRIDKIGEAAFVDLPTLKKLSLSNNEISELEYGSFHRVPQLRTLDLNKNRVRRVHPESFLQHSGSGLEELWLIDNDISHIVELRSLLDALPRLVFLDMSHNNLEEIPFGALRGHPTLERLHLDYNRISLIEREAFMAMPALRELRLKNNSLTDNRGVPLWNLPALKGLDLSGNFLRVLNPGLLSNLPSLRRVDLSRNELTLIDPEAFLMNPEVEHVNLSFNALTSLHPATFRHLLNLYDLDVSHNFLMEFVPNLPRGLEYLHMSHNQISAIPSQPDLDLPSLRMLDFSRNNLNRIPPRSLQSLLQLRRLYVGRNGIKRLEEDSLAGLSRLEVVDLQRNKITQIHQNSLRGMNELKEINVRSNRLDLVSPELFRDSPTLRRIDFSDNQIAEILPGTFNSNKDLQAMDMSDNFLVQLPPNLGAMKKLRFLDLTNNRIKDLQPEIINSLSSLREMRLANNYIRDLRHGVFDNLQHLRVLQLDSNELEIVEPNAIRSLPILKSLKLNRNKLVELPSLAFNNLPQLQIAELQENQLRSIAPDAFHHVPHLLSLNLSHNELSNLEEAGLRTLKSLELLDVSNNKIAKITSPSLEKMEYLVELRMSDNKICGVQGTPFDAMSRLRVLNMRNNKLVSLPERSVQKLRGNIALLDLDGNPLACTCNLLWLQAWLQEGPSQGPRCSDGTSLRELRLSRQECPPEDRQDFAPGCEAELLSLDNQSAAVLSPNTTTKRDEMNLPPTPEDSEYFYDEYIDYPYNNETTHPEQVSLIQSPTTRSPHVTSGDTPTLYAATNKNKTRPSDNIPKEVPNSPSTSGFTFFGVPLPSLNNLIGGGRTDKKTTDNVPVADRKTAIVNKVAFEGQVNRPRTGARGGLNLPNAPQFESGGFVPILPGSGGFKPIAGPIVQLDKEQQEVPTIEIVSNSTEPYLLRNDGPLMSMGHPLPTPSPPPTTTSEVVPIATLLVEELDEQVTISPMSELETAPSYPEFPQVEEETLGPSTVLMEPVVELTTPSSTTTTQFVVVTSEIPKKQLVVDDRELVLRPPDEYDKKPTPLSALLVPGGQQPEFRASGKSTITKVAPPLLRDDVETLGNGNVPDPQPHNREGKTSKRPLSVEDGVAKSSEDSSWYFANYNKTHLQPFVGGTAYASCGAQSVFSFFVASFVMTIVVFVQ